jgi:hypothetical protein
LQAGCKDQYQGLLESVKNMKVNKEEELEKAKSKKILRKLDSLPVN